MISMCTPRDEKVYLHCVHRQLPGRVKPENVDARYVETDEDGAQWCEEGHCQAAKDSMGNENLVILLNGVLICQSCGCDSVPILGGDLQEW